MIDFPASPTDGQIFSATNGVVYKWSAAYTSWLGGAPGPVVGDFSANITNPPLTTTAATILFNSILTGNSGGYYNSANGRWTPPAGRYWVHGQIQGYSGSALTQITLYIRKNGVVLPNGNPTQATPSVNYQGSVTLDVIVDANGSDWFDVQGACGGGGYSGGFAWFNATPTQGMIGPPGPPGPLPAGALSLYSEQVLVAAANQIVVAIPPTPRLVRLEWGVQSAGAVNDSVLLQAMLSGVPFTGANYETQQLNGSSSTPTAQMLTGQTAYILAGGVVETGWWETSMLPSAINSGSFHFGTGQTFEIQTGGVRNLRQLGTYFNTASPASSQITGFRLTPNTNNFAAGSYMRCLVLP